MATNQQEVTLVSKLYATGLVLDIETLKWDEHHIAQMKESLKQSDATKGVIEIHFTDWYNNMVHTLRLEARMWAGDGKFKLILQVMA